MNCIVCNAEVEQDRGNTNSCEFCGHLPWVIVDLVRKVKGVSYDLYLDDLLPIHFDAKNAAQNPTHCCIGDWDVLNVMTYPTIVKRCRDIALLDEVAKDMKYYPQQDNKYPHTCPKCGSPAYIGFASLDCSKGCK